MRFYQSHRKYLVAIGVEPRQPFEKNQPMIVWIRRLLVLICFVVCATLSSAYLGYEAKTLNEYADSFYFSISLVTICTIMAIIFWKMDSLFKLIGDVEKLIEQRMKNPEMTTAYVKLNENIEKWTGAFYFFMVQVNVPAIMIPQFIISFYLYFATDLGGEAFSLPIQIWVPFEWRTPIGYSIVFTFEYAVILIGAHFSASYITIFTASCYIIFILCNDIKNEIRVLDESSKAGTNSVQLMKRVGDIVEFHAATKQLVLDMDNLFALTILMFFAWSLSSICSILLVVQMQLELHANPLELVKPIFLAFWSFADVFLICEFGQMLTAHFDQLTDVINGCDWTSFPKEIQKILPIIIQNTQRELVLETFKNTSCSRETFKKVVNKGFSYFMVFREFR